MLEDEAGSLEVTALDDIEHFDDVGVVEGFQEMVLSFDFDGLDRQQHLDGDFLFVFLVSTLEDVGVFASSNLMGDGVLFQLSAFKKRYPQGRSMASYKMAFTSSRFRFTDV